MKSLVRRERADLDVQETIDYYLQHAPEAALAFVNALEQTYQQIQRRPTIGSPRYAHELEISAMQAFPLSWFYVETAQQIDIWRVLHGSRDIPAWLTEAT